MSILLVAVSVLVASCGGDEGETAAVAGGGGGGGGGGGNSAPTITGTPPTTLMQGTTYSFKPTVNDADGDSLTFTATGLPSWASIDAGTGEVSGTPGPGDLGLSTGIMISVFDGAVTVAFGPFEINVVATATGSATLSWTAPTENTDGSPLLDLDGFKIYWGMSPGSYPNSHALDAGTLTYMVEDLTPGTWYFVATAINSVDVESAFSNPASKVITAP